VDNISAHLQVHKNQKADDEFLIRFPRLVKAVDTTNELWTKLFNDIEKSYYYFTFHYWSGLAKKSWGKIWSYQCALWNFLVGDIN
jgi:hypothetical protein